jgi:hypothetical protein
LEAVPFSGFAVSAALLLAGEKLEIATRFLRLSLGILLSNIEWVAR